MSSRTCFGMTQTGGSRTHLFDLIYYKYFERIIDAIAREKQLKNWHKDWKINLIKPENPEMRGLKADLEF